MSFSIQQSTPISRILSKIGSVSNVNNIPSYEGTWNYSGTLNEMTLSNGNVSTFSISGQVTINNLGNGFYKVHTTDPIPPYNVVMDMGDSLQGQLNIGDWSVFFFDNGVFHEKWQTINSSTKRFGDIILTK